MNAEEIEFIDELLSRLEDFTHGQDGKDITKARKMLIQSQPKQLSDEEIEELVNEHLPIGSLEDRDVELQAARQDGFHMACKVIPNLFRSLPEAYLKQLSDEEIDLNGIASNMSVDEWVNVKLKQLHEQKGIINTQGRDESEVDKEIALLEARTGGGVDLEDVIECETISTENGNGLVLYFNDNEKPHDLADKIDHYLTQRNQQEKG